MVFAFPFLAQQSVTTAATDPSTLLYVTLLFIFLTAIVTTVLTKWTRDKCLKFFHRYHVTLERTRGQTSWGSLRVFSSGIEIVYDAPYIDALGRKKTSFLSYQHELEQQVLSILRFHDELGDEAKLARQAQIQSTFNPGPLRRAWRGVRNFVNTLRDAFNNAIGAVVGQYQRMNPTSAVMGAQAGSVTSIGQTLLGKFANAYEPLLEQYIGQPVILDVADPLNPNNATVQYTGYLADYTQNFIAIFNVQHSKVQEIVLDLPDIERGEALPPIPPPPPPGGTAMMLPPPITAQQGLNVRIDGMRMKIHNTRFESVVVRRLVRDGYAPIEFGVIVPPNAFLDLPARDARGAKLYLDVIQCLDVVAPRKFATIRHAGEQVERTGFVDELHLDALPLVPNMFRRRDESPPAAGAQSDPARNDASARSSNGDER